MTPEQIDEYYNYLLPPAPEEDEFARLLGLIDAEWRSDPTSVACFDLRIAAEVQKALAKHAARKARFEPCPNQRGESSDEAVIEAIAGDAMPAMIQKRHEERPEDKARAFLQAAVDNAPEPLLRLGEWLVQKLDDDDWETAARLLNGAAFACSALMEERDEARSEVNEKCESISAWRYRSQMAEIALAALDQGKEAMP